MKENNPLQNFTAKKIAIPVLIGLIVSGLLVYNVSKFNTSSFSSIEITTHLLIGLGLGVLTVLVRDIAYIYRIWQLSNKQISFKRCIEVILLWEFGSAITPASVGGVTLAVFILNREKLSLGKSTSIILVSSYLDNIAFVIVFSFLYFLLGSKMFLFADNCADLKYLSVLQTLRYLAEYAWIGFFIVAFTGGILGFSIFIKPQWAKTFFYKIATFKLFEKWKEKIENFGDEIWQTSNEFKNRERFFVTKVLIATIISWCARYALANALIWGFSTIPHDQLIVFSRQYLHRILTMIPLTPGGSGLMEASFMALNCDFLPTGFSDKVAVIWRLYNFYIYLLLGIFIFPRWLKRVTKK